MIYEEKILDYLDGALGDKESAELMHQLSVSPERRVILEQHLQLKNAIGDARKPFAVPTAIEARLAERLPAIASYNREIGVGTSLLTETVRAPYFKRVAATVAMLLLIGTASYLGITRNGDDHGTGVISGTSSSIASSAKSDPTANAMEPTVDASRNIISKPSETHSPAVTNVVRQNSYRSIIEHNDILPADQPVIMAPIPEESIRETAMQVISRVDNLRGTELPALTNIGRNPHSPAMRLPMEEPFDLPLALRLDYSVGQSYNQVRESDASVTFRNAIAPAIGIDYVISPNIALGIEGGKTDISRVQEISTIENDEELGINRVVLSHDVITRSEFNARAMLRYTLNPYDPIRIETSIGGGAAFGNSISPLVSWSTMLNYQLTEKIGLIGGAAFTGTFARTGGAVPIATGNEPTAFVVTDAASSSLFTPSFVLKVGVRISPW